MSARVFVDTNVLVYLFDTDAPEKQRRSQQLLETEGISGDLVLSTQVLQEFYVNVTRKLAVPLSTAEAYDVTRRFTAFHVAQIDGQTVLAAINFSREHSFSFWDALIFQTAREASCQLLLSEDLQDGFTFGGLRIENPYRDQPKTLS